MTMWSRVISLIGLGDLDRRPWTAVEEATPDAEHGAWWAGHVQLRAGTLP